MFSQSRRFIVSQFISFGSIYMFDRINKVFVYMSARRSWNFEPIPVFRQSPHQKKIGKLKKKKFKNLSIKQKQTKKNTEDTKSPYLYEIIVKNN